MTASGPGTDLPEFDVDDRLRDGLLQLLAEDRATLALGVDRIRSGPDELELWMTVAPSHSNGHGICHGGVVYSLADSAVGLAANSEPGDDGWVTANASIEHLAAARVGTVLVARCRQVSAPGDRIRIFLTEVAAGAECVAVVQSTMRRMRSRE